MLLSSPKAAAKGSVTSTDVVGNDPKSVGKLPNSDSNAAAAEVAAVSAFGSEEVGKPSYISGAVKEVGSNPNAASKLLSSKIEEPLEVEFVGGAMSLLRTIHWQTFPHCHVVPTMKVPRRQMVAQLFAWSQLQF